MLRLPRQSTLFPYTTLFRSRVHLALAEVLLGADERDRRAWHRAAAALGPADDVADDLAAAAEHTRARGDRKSTRLNSSHVRISYAVFCLKKKNKLEKFKLIF